MEKKNGSNEWSPETRKEYDEWQLKKYQDLANEEFKSKKYIHGGREWTHFSNNLLNEYFQFKEGERVICQVSTPDQQDPADNLCTLYARKTPSSELEKIFDGYNNKFDALDSGNEYADRYIERQSLEKQRAKLRERARQNKKQSKSLGQDKEQDLER